MSRVGRGSDYYDERREYRNGRSRYDEYDDYRRGPPPREREREVLIREEVRERDRVRDGPAYLREDYGRTEAGPVVLRKRETEEFDLVERPPRPASPEPERKVEKEEIIIRRDESEHRGPGRPRERSREREEIIIRRREDDDVRSVAHSHRGGEREKEEIIIRRTEEDDRASRRGGRSEVGRYDTRPISHERERSRTRGGQSDSEEIIIRNTEERGRGGENKQEIIIRRHSRSNSPSSASGRGRPLDPPIINAPPIHQEIITHHRHIDHGFEVRPRPTSRPPSPPSPPRPRERSEERIEIRRSGERNGEHYNEDIIIDRQETSRARSPRPPIRDPLDDDYPLPRPGPPPGALAPYRPGYDRDVQDEADYYNGIAMRRAYPGEAYNGATRDWGIVDVPPGTRRVRMDGQGGGGQDITWTRYNGVRRSRFRPDDRDGYLGGELSRPEALGGLGPQYGRRRDPTDGLWTEITKDLVVKEAIEEMGYEYEETDDFYYIIAYLRYVSARCFSCESHQLTIDLQEDVARLVGLSEDIRRARQKRVREMGWENRVAPPPLIEPRPRPAIEPPPERTWDREDERYIEREVVYRGGRPPPPPGWRR